MSLIRFQHLIALTICTAIMQFQNTVLSEIVCLLIVSAPTAIRHSVATWAVKISPATTILGYTVFVTRKQNINEFCCSTNY